SVFFFFFSSRRRHTRWPRDWSSDVCSSDLEQKDRPRLGARRKAEAAVHEHEEKKERSRVDVELEPVHRAAQRQVLEPLAKAECRSEERRVGKECRSRWSADH